MKRKPKAPVMPKLPAHFTENLAKVAKGLHPKAYSHQFCEKVEYQRRGSKRLVTISF